MKLQKILLSFLIFYTCFSTLKAQFATSQKDSVINYLKYPTGQYDVSMNFTAASYNNQVGKDDLENLSEEALLKKITNTPKDAIIYAKLVLNRYKKKINDQKINEYYDKTIQNYEAQINENPKNIKIILELLDFLNTIQDGNSMEKVLNYGLEIEPNHIELLQYLTSFHLNYTRDFEKAEEYITKASKLDKYDISVMVLRASVNQFKALKLMKQGQNTEIDTRFIEEIFKEKPNEIKYEHIYHYARCSKIYLSAFTKLSNDTTFLESENPFDKIILNKQQEKTIKEAEIFFVKNTKKSTKYQANMLENLAFVYMLQKKYKEAIKNYELFFEQSKNVRGLEACILLYYLQKNKKKAIEYAEKRTQQTPDVRTSCLLLRLYDEANNIQKAIKEVETIKNLADNVEKVKAETLAVYYLKQKDTKIADNYIKSFENQTESKILLLKLVKNILENDNNEAENNLQQILTQNPKDKKALKIKKILNF